jgi:hypothetical protein
VRFQRSDLSTTTEALFLVPMKITFPPEKNLSRGGERCSLLHFHLLGLLFDSVACKFSPLALGERQGTRGRLVTRLNIIEQTIFRSLLFILVKRIYDVFFHRT